MKRSVDLMFLMVVISCIGFGLVGCGDTETSASGAATETGSGSGTLSLEAQVSVASTSSFSLPGLVVKNVTESTASNKTVTCQDLTGATIGTCTTDSSGECTITGITEDQVKAGVVLVAATDTVLLHSYRQYTAEEIAATPAGTSLEAVPVNSEEDMAYAVAQTACSGNLASCDTVDRDCVVEATTAMATGGSPSESDMKGYVEAMLEAHKVAISNAPAGTSPADLLKKGLDGDPAAYTGVAGTRTPTGSVPISDAVQNFDAMMDKITTAYCAKTDAATKSVWQQVREDAKTGQETFQPKAVIGIFEGFKPSELGEYEIEDFRGFAQALPQLDNGFDMFANHEKARLAARNMFREGAFTDPSKAPVALGVVASTFPAPKGDDWKNVSFDSFDPTQAGRAARNLYLDLTASNTSTDPNTIFDGFHETFRQPTYLQSAANGGATDFVNRFLDAPGNFSASGQVGLLSTPPGGSCTSSSECLPCDTCTSGVCTSNSAKMGASCSSDADCDSITKCVGGINITFSGGTCMCASACPTGANVYATAGGPPQDFGVAGGIAPPLAGLHGAPCSTTITCGPGLSCSDPVAGVCIGSDFKKGPYASCSGNSECLSNSCASGLCAPSGDTAGTKTNGLACASPSECASNFCGAGFCSDPPTVFAAATTAGAALRKADGETCTTSAECGSNFCNAQFVCAQLSQTGPSGGPTPPPPSGLPTGSPCSSPTQCTSMVCNFSLPQPACQ